MTDLDRTMTPRRQKEGLGRAAVEAAMRRHAEELLSADLVRRHRSIGDVVQALQDMIDHDFLVPCVVSDAEPWILLVPRSTSADLGGPFDPLTLLGGEGAGYPLSAFRPQASGTAG